MFPRFGQKQQIRTHLKASAHHNMGGKRKKIDGSGCGILDRLSLTDLLNVLTEVKRMMMQKTKKKMMRGVKMNLLRMMKRTRNDEHMKP